MTLNCREPIPNAKLEQMDIEPDGCAWGEHIRTTIGKTDLALANRLRLDDCEMGTCVIWVESDEDCRILLEITWNLIFG